MQQIQSNKIPRDIDNFLHLFLNDVPMIDVRAPVEFHRGSFPTATNLPLLNDVERQEVGTTYKKQGQDAAVRLGHQLVSGDVKAARIEHWREFAKQNPDGCLFCFRGGMRSHITRQWLGEAQTPYPLVKGGYKAMRNFLISQTDRIVTEKPFAIISGRTGTGKTTVIHRLNCALDLEGIAHHRGSSFGRRMTPQPSQINFENALAIRLLKLSHDSEGIIFIEDESRLVGRCALPLGLLSQMKKWPLVVVEESLENRISNIQKDYVTGLLAEHLAAYDEAGFSRFSGFLRDSLQRIQKRLGGARHQEISALLENALSLHRETGDESLHRTWIYELLAHYYDPMYDYQMSAKENPVAFRGSRAEVLEWCEKSCRRP